MELLKKSDLTEIENHLKNLGCGNHKDNMKQIKSYKNHYSVELSKEEFLSLVFLESSTTKILCVKSRKLVDVASEAINLPNNNLGKNWDIDKVLDKWNAFHKEGEVPPVEEIVLRDTKNSEINHGRYYLQDGCHRSLAYAIALIKDEVEYTPQIAFLATNEDFIIND